MLSDAARSSRDRFRQLAVLSFELGKALVAVAPGIDVESDEAALFVHLNADIRQGRFAPPFSDLLFVSRRFVAPVLVPRMLSLCLTHCAKPAGAGAILLEPMEREYGDPRSCISECCLPFLLPP